MEKQYKITKAEVNAALSIIKDLRAESDRAAVILGASNLEQLLYQILQKYLLPYASAGDDLFDGDGPLSSFRVKIDLSYRLGLIDDACSRSLHLIRKIRNDFAHEGSQGTLSTGRHRDRVKSLTAKFEDLTPYQDIKEGFLGGREATPSDEFRIIVSFLPVYLTLVLNMLTPLTPLDIPLSLFRTTPDQEAKP
jgi:DNA-binding MltR family transcriptional regulator